MPAPRRRITQDKATDLLANARGWSTTSRPRAIRLEARATGPSFARARSELQGRRAADVPDGFDDGTLARGRAVRRLPPQVPQPRAAT